jgi:hypothetical protein
MSGPPVTVCAESRCTQNGRLASLALAARRLCRLRFTSFKQRSHKSTVPYSVSTCVATAGRSLQRSQSRIARTPIRVFGSGLPTQPGLQIRHGVQHGLPFTVANTKARNRPARGRQPPKRPGTDSEGLSRVAGPQSKSCLICMRYHRERLW